MYEMASSRSRGRIAENTAEEDMLRLALVATRAQRARRVPVRRPRTAIHDHSRSNSQSAWPVQPQVLQSGHFLSEQGSGVALRITSRHDLLLTTARLGGLAVQIGRAHV